MKHIATPSVDLERTIELDLVRVTEAAALNTFQWVGKGDKNAADQAASDAIRGMFDLLPVCGEVIIGEGIKDNAPGIFLGEQLGSWEVGSLKMEIAIDPVDGTTNVSKGLPNSISVLAAAAPEPGQEKSLCNIPSFYCQKLAYGPRILDAMSNGVIEPIKLMDPIELTLQKVAKALHKRVQDLIVVLLDRPRHDQLVKEIRSTGAAIRMISDGDVAGAIAPSLPENGVDLYCGMGGSTEAVLAAAALRCLGGEIQAKMWPRDDKERQTLIDEGHEKNLDTVYSAEDMARGRSIFFCATGISDGPFLPGLKMTEDYAITHSIVMRTKHRTIRFIKGHHDLAIKTIRLRSSLQEHKL
jgi:fructose-1,6-bisphosphatase II